MNDDLLTVGKKGDKLLLTKTQIKPGCTSGRRVGKVLDIMLGKPIACGHPVVNLNKSSRQRTMGMLVKHKQTSNVQKITATEETNEFMVETETSIYFVHFRKE